MRHGQVEYSADFYILKPVDIAKGNGAIFYEASNRGKQGDPRPLQQRQRPQQRSLDRRACRRRLPDAARLHAGVERLDAGPAERQQPAADHVPPPQSGRPIAQTTWDELLFNDGKTEQGRLTYRAASTDKSEAKLIVRERNSDDARDRAADQWEFVDARTIRLLPAGTPFRVGMIYQLIYKAANPPVNGDRLCGHARPDLVPALRQGGRCRHAQPARRGRPASAACSAHGNSQTGRYLRDFIYRGFNEDEDNRIVLDGALPNVAAGRHLSQLSLRQPNRIIPAGHGFMLFPGAGFPFAYETQTDPFTGQNDGILARCTARGNCPKVIHTIAARNTGKAPVARHHRPARHSATARRPKRAHLSFRRHPARREGGPCRRACAPTPVNTADYRPFLRASWSRSTAG